MNTLRVALCFGLLFAGSAFSAPTGVQSPGSANSTNDLSTRQAPQCTQYCGGKGGDVIIRKLVPEDELSVRQAPCVAGCGGNGGHGTVILGAEELSSRKAPCVMGCGGDGGHGTVIMKADQEDELSSRKAPCVMGCGGDGGNGQVVIGG